jgi:peptidoglycan/xylan/chitin deacetylase (PgdA/CDA1 family)
VHRRTFLAALAAGTLSALTGCTHDSSKATPGDLITGAIRAANAADGPTGSHGPAPAPLATVTSPLRLPSQSGNSLPPPLSDKPTAGRSVLLDRLIDGHDRLALTVDDGVSTEVTSAYVDFAATSGIRMTFFVNGWNTSWDTVKERLRPMVESGQIQLANHTWDHPSITKLSANEIEYQLDRNERFLRNAYGVEGRPYFRPPFGSHNHWTDRILGELGFTRNVLWCGSLGDAAVLPSEQILALAKEWFLPERLVIGHADHPGVTHIYPQLIELIRQRNLQTVTLRDVYGDAR